MCRFPINGRPHQSASNAKLTLPHLRPLSEDAQDLSSTLPVSPAACQTCQLQGLRAKATSAPLPHPTQLQLNCRLRCLPTSETLQGHKPLCLVLLQCEPLRAPALTVRRRLLTQGPASTFLLAALPPLPWDLQSPADGPAALGRLNSWTSSPATTSPSS